MAKIFQRPFGDTNTRTFIPLVLFHHEKFPLITTLDQEDNKLFDLQKEFLNNYTDSQKLTKLYDYLNLPELIGKFARP